MVIFKATSEAHDEDDVKTQSMFLSQLVSLTFWNYVRFYFYGFWLLFTGRGFCCCCVCFYYDSTAVPYSLWSVGALRDIWQSYLELRVDKIILWLLSKFYFCSHSHSNIWTKHTKQNCWYLKLSSCIAIYISKLWKEYFVKVKLENLFWLFLG